MRQQIESMVFVQNQNKFEHTDMFNGDVYSFPHGEKVAITREAATHFFGFGQPDKSDVLRRLGWHVKVDNKGKLVEDPDGVKKLANFKFTEAVITEAKVSSVDDPMLV